LRLAPRQGRYHKGEKPMKKKLISLALVCAMVFALGATAFASDTGTPINQDSTPKTGNTKVSYSVDPTYTITIPSSVALSNTAQSKTLKAENVILEGGKKITVTLTAASNTANGESTFNAKNGDTSVAKYTIKTGETDIAVGDKVAEFTANGDQTLTFTLGDITGVKVAGDHTETLTFTIAMKTTRTVTFNTATDGKTINKDGVTCSNSFDNYNNIFDSNSKFSVSSGQFTKIEVTANDVFGIDFGSTASGYSIIYDSLINFDDSDSKEVISSELIMDCETEIGLRIGNKAHYFPKNRIKPENKLYFSKFKKNLDPKNNNNYVESNVPEGVNKELKNIIKGFLILLREEIEINN
jgi:hypothetical protein